ncbi:DinB family protein [Ornithinibacillus contaminans]|uniref:DinB family protein n=1 Tax=Ornithinibacillus contaminans TaxID=694055 RepID=UPI00064DCFC8|nr:DinB family protein [Ornithinibacillus contaminans]
MQKLFEYNWQVREDWFNWCEDVPEEELLKERTGGIGSILYTLFHIIDVEYSWTILDMKGEKDKLNPSFETCNTLEKIREFSRQANKEVKPFVSAWTNEMEDRIFTETYSNGEQESFKHGEIMRHVIAHEIHHIGQLSIWSREIGKAPVTANLIRRGLFD